jgi:hypothetical protein
MIQIIRATCLSWVMFTVLILACPQEASAQTVARLQTMTLTGGTLSPTFNRDITDYIYDVGQNATSTTFKATTQGGFPGSRRVRINGGTYSSYTSNSSLVVQLATDETLIEIEVYLSASDNRVYKILVRKPYVDGRSRILFPAAPLKQLRQSHRASVLPDGRVMVTGGIVPSEPDLFPPPSTEIYNPSLDEWTNGPELPGRTSHIQETLKDGRVLVAGGSSMVGTSEKTFLFHPTPAPGYWVEVGSMNYPKAGASSVLLNDGKVLVIGGGSQNDSHAEVFDPSTETWTMTEPVNIARAVPLLTKLADGRVLVTGGYVSSVTSKVAEIYDPETGAWTPTTSMNVARVWHGASLLADGKVLVSAGYTPNQQTALTTEVYDPVAETWTTAAPLALARQSPVQLTLSTGEVVLHGGAVSTPGIAFEMLRPASSQWRIGVRTDAVPYDHTATLMPDDRILITGGQLRTPQFSWIMNPHTQILELADSKLKVRDGPSVVASDDQLSMGSPVWGTPVNKTLTLTNSSTTEMKLQTAEITGGTVGEFSASAPSLTTLAAGASTTLAITFQPTVPGERTATFYLPTKLGTDNVILFPIQLTGTGASGMPLYEDWAEGVGLIGERTGPQDIYYADGVENLLKYAFNMSTAGPDASLLTAGGSSGLPMVTFVPGATRKLRLEYVRRKNSGLIYSPEHAIRLDDFQPMTATPTVTSIDASWERVVIEQPTSGDAAFARVKVSLP